MADHRFTAELARELRRPFAPEEVRYKVQQVLGENKGALVVPYIDARSVIGRLNRLAPGRWRAVHEALPLSMRLTMPDGAGGLVPARRDENGRLVPDHALHYRCTLTVCGARFEDVGEGEDPKSAHADSLKRAAVRAGVGESLYQVGLPRLWLGQGDDELRTDRRGRPMLDERTLAFCRARYAAWLGETGIAAFGEPLGRGAESGGAVLLALPGAGAPLPERIAAAARALPGELAAETVAALAALLAGREEVPDQLELAEAEGAELIRVLGLAKGAGWSAERLTELLGRAMRAPIAPAERRAGFLAHLERAGALAAA